MSRDHACRCSADEALEVTAQSQGSTQILSASGQVDVATTAALAGAIRIAIASAPQIVVVDRSAVVLRGRRADALLQTDGHARAEGCQLIVIAGDGAAHRLFERTNAQRRLTIAS